VVNATHWLWKLCLSLPREDSCCFGSGILLCNNLQLVPWDVVQHLVLQVTLTPRGVLPGGRSRACSQEGVHWPEGGLAPPMSIVAPPSSSPDLDSAAEHPEDSEGLEGGGAGIKTLHPAGGSVGSSGHRPSLVPSEGTPFVRAKAVNAASVLKVGGGPVCMSPCQLEFPTV
jgi:hypothetical protein